MQDPNSSTRAEQTIKRFQNQRWFVIIVVVAAIVVPLAAIISFPKTVIESWQVIKSAWQPATTLPRACVPPDIRANLPIQGAITVDDVQKFDLNGDKIEELGVISSGIKENSVKNRYFDLLSCDQNTLSWKNVLHMDNFGATGCAYNVQDVAIAQPNERQVLLTNVCGSGGYLNYKLVGLKGTNQAITLLEQDGVFMGTVSITEQALIIQNLDRAWANVWNGTNFVSREVGFTPDSNSIVVNYWVSVQAP